MQKLTREWLLFLNDKKELKSSTIINMWDEGCSPGLHTRHSNHLNMFKRFTEFTAAHMSYVKSLEDKLTFLKCKVSYLFMPAGGN